MKARRATSTAGLLLGLLLVAGPGSSQAQALIADLSRHLIAITTGFTGTDLLMFGAIDGPGDVVVVVRGPADSVRVREKRRIAGIWVSRDSMTFGEVPSFYAVSASRDLGEILPPEVLIRQGIGVDNLRLTTPADAAPREIAAFRAALVRNKQQQGLFVRAVGKVNFLGGQLFRSNVYFPANVPTGNYLVEVLLARGGEVVGAQTTPLIVSKIGVGAEISDFARQRSASYGALAIVGALMAGWMAHLVFRRI